MPDRGEELRRLPDQRGEKPAPTSASLTRRTVLWVAAACVAVFAGTFSLVNYLVMPRAVHSIREVEMPDVSRMTFEDAQRTLAAAGLEATRSAEVPDPTVPAGRVISTDPSAGMAVKAGRMVSLTMSSGPEMVRVPPLARQTLRRGELLLQSIGLSAGQVTYAYSSDVPRGLIVDASPPAESLTAPGSVVNLRVSLGEPPPDAVMPDVRGWRVDGVAALLRERGFRVAVLGTVEGEAAGDRVVVDQYPPAGNTVTEGDSVLIVAGQAP